MARSPKPVAVVADADAAGAAVETALRVVKAAVAVVAEAAAAIETAVRVERPVAAVVKAPAVVTKTVVLVAEAGAAVETAAPGVVVFPAANRHIGGGCCVPCASRTQESGAMFSNSQKCEMKPKCMGCIVKMAKKMQKAAMVSTLDVRTAQTAADDRHAARQQQESEASGASRATCDAGADGDDIHACTATSTPVIRSVVTATVLRAVVSASGPGPAVPQQAPLCARCCRTHRTLGFNASLCWARNSGPGLPLPELA